MNMKWVVGFPGLVAGCMLSLAAYAEEPLAACRLMATSSVDDRAVVLCNGKMETLASGAVFLDKQYSVMQILQDKIVLRDQATHEMLWMQLSVNDAPSFVQRFATRPDKAGNKPVMLEQQAEKATEAQQAKDAGN